jgi:hypothetical protein
MVEFLVVELFSSLSDFLAQVNRVDLKIWIMEERRNVLKIIRSYIEVGVMVIYCKIDEVEKVSLLWLFRCPVLIVIQCVCVLL